MICGSGMLHIRGCLLQIGSGGSHGTYQRYFLGPTTRGTMQFSQLLIVVSLRPETQWEHPWFAAPKMMRKPKGDCELISAFFRKPQSFFLDVWCKCIFLVCSYRPLHFLLGVLDVQRSMTDLRCHSTTCCWICMCVWCFVYVCACVQLCFCWTYDVCVCVCHHP